MGPMGVRRGISEKRRELTPHREFWRQRPPEDYAENLRESDALRNMAASLGEKVKAKADALAGDCGIDCLDTESLAGNLARMFRYGRALNGLISREVERTYGKREGAGAGVD